ncbi:hypothetical protein P280DRAFT_18258 [Massarina eburnea CBS 473.64]|uniref:Uncharacterized protein n=1 Tax=Massarina eburnea CBS 473.64 TaxID=1395130 RepID=A0A6A6SJE7_9PLEO|nr:hypothetical protein P280DRAFT_18258 [Massarina eburnea CBS 473.64]
MPNPIPHLSLLTIPMRCHRTVQAPISKPSLHRHPETSLSNGDHRDGRTSRPYVNHVEPSCLTPASPRLASPSSIVAPTKVPLTRPDDPIQFRTDSIASPEHTRASALTPGAELWYRRLHHRHGVSFPRPRITFLRHRPQPHQSERISPREFSFSSKTL